MRNYYLIAGAVLLIAALLGAFISFSSPAEVTAQQQVKVLEYQQEGTFDYTVTSRPNYFYGGTPPAASEPISPIPVKFIESFNLNYNYQPAPGDANGTIEINAILESPGNWKKTVNLVPAGNFGADIAFPLNISFFQGLADTIEKEIGINSFTYDLTVEAIVSGENGTKFVQTLPIKLTRTYIQISDNLVGSIESRTGEFSYQVKLSENTLFGPVTLTPSKIADPQTKIILGPGDTVFTKFVESTKINFSYNLTSNQPLRQIQEEVTVDAVLESPERWTKTYNLVAPTKKEGNINLSIPLDINQFITIFDTIQTETGVAASANNLTLKVTMHTQAQTDSGPIDEIYIQSIQTNLRNALLTWTGDMKKSASGSVTVPVLVTTEVTMLGLPVLWVRIISVALLVILLALLAYYLRFKPKVVTLSPAEVKARQISQKYKELIVEVNERPGFKSEQTVLPMDSIQDLIKVAQGLLKPIHHVAEKDAHIYWVNDDSTRYQFFLLNGKTEKDLSETIEKRLDLHPDKKD